MEKRGVTSSRPSLSGLRVEWMKEINRLTVRTLTPRVARPGREILGYFTRWLGKHSQYVPLSDLPPAGERKKEHVWVGFVLCQAWNDDRRLWEGIVLQVTENLEVDMRGHYDRGQIWEIVKQKPGKKGSPISGARIGDCDLATLPPAVCFLDVLRVMWHVPDLQAGSIANPMPPRIYLADSSDAPPPGSKAKQEADDLAARPSADELERQRRERKRLLDDLAGRPVNGTAGHK
jgi:hypothetical protein